MLRPLPQLLFSYLYSVLRPPTQPPSAPIHLSLYMLLQRVTDTPFRVVDEINQGMDPINERKVGGGRERAKWGGEGGMDSTKVRRDY